MNQTELAMHFVSTHEGAEDLVKAHNQFWVSNCGCRESRKECARSRMDVCLIFNPDDPGIGSGKKEVSLADVMEIIHEARTRQLVARPYRNQARTDTDGICLCCDDCCGYFLDPSERCDKGEFVAETNFDVCNHCGACEAACYFKARKMNEDELSIENELCYGCVLCIATCPEDCIQMVRRT